MSRAFADAIIRVKEDAALRRDMAAYNRKTVIPFCIGNTVAEVLQLIASL